MNAEIFQRASVLGDSNSQIRGVVTLISVDATRVPIAPFYVNQKVLAPCGLAIVRSIRQNKSDTHARGQWMVDVRPEAGAESGRSKSIETYFADECEATAP